MKLSDFIPQYTEWSRGVHKNSTVLANSLALRKFADCVGYETDLQDVKRLDAERFVSLLRASNLANASINNHIRHLKTAFSRAVGWEQIPSSPFAKTKMLPLDKKPPKHISRNKMAGFLAGIECFDLRMLITALFATGRKRQELLGLKWSDIDTENKTYRVQTAKSGTKDFNINGAFRVILSLLRSNLSTQLSLMKEKRRSEGWVFPRWSNPDSVTHIVKQELKKGGYEKLNLMSFQYSFAEVYPPNGGDYRISKYDRTLFKGLSLNDHMLKEINEPHKRDEYLVEEVCISSDVKTERKIVFCPKVFDVPEGAVDAKLVAVMMPFKGSLNSVFDTIKESVDANGLICRRADDIWKSSEIIQDIFELIYKSHIVVCDLTSKNPNVFYETGIAHTLGKHVIPISQSSEGMPFDLFHHRHIFYHNNTEGRARLKEKLSERIKYLIQHKVK